MGVIGAGAALAIDAVAARIPAAAIVRNIFIANSQVFDSRRHL